MRTHPICAIFLVVVATSHWLQGQQLQFEKTLRLEANGRLALPGLRAGQIYSISARATGTLGQPLTLVTRTAAGVWRVAGSVAEL